MKVNEFLNEVLAAAKAAGIDPAEVYYHGGDSFNVSALDGKISDYKVASSCGVSLRGMFGGKKTGLAAPRCSNPVRILQRIGRKKRAIRRRTDREGPIWPTEARQRAESLKRQADKGKTERGRQWAKKWP